MCVRSLFFLPFRKKYLHPLRACLLVKIISAGDASMLGSTSQTQCTLCICCVSQKKQNNLYEKLLLLNSYVMLLIYVILFFLSVLFSSTHVKKNLLTNCCLTAWNFFHMISNLI